MKSCKAQITHTPRAKGPLITGREVFVLGVAALVCALPMLIHGPMVKGHDTYEHLNYSRHFSDQFWAGESSPRWLLDMNHGLGSPSLFVYPPFASYVYTFLQPLSKVLWFNPFIVGEVLALLGSGMSAFLWASTLATRRLALISAALYMILPYHLAVDYYRRNALSECWALVWMPLVLYFAAGVTEGKRNSRIGLAIAFALLILSHFVSVLIFGLIPLMASATFSPPGDRKQLTFRVAGGMALGTGLSSFYLLPALSSAKYFPALRLLRPPSFVLGDNLVGWDDVAHVFSKAGFAHWVAVSALTTIAFTVFCSGTIFWIGNSTSQKSTGFWIAMSALPVFMMLRVSAGIWSFSRPHFSWILLRAVQYPWRLNIVVCLSTLSISAVLFSEMRCLSRVKRNATMALISLLVLPWLISYAKVWSRYRTDVFTANPRQLVNDDDGWFYAWAAPELDQASALKATAEPRVRFVDGIGTSQVRLWKARDIGFDTDSSTGGWVEINQFYYPKWTASVLGTSQPLQIETAMPEGLLKVEVPAGHQQIRVAIPIQPAERIGRWISLASVLLCGMVGWKERFEASLLLLRSQVGLLPSET